MTDLDTDIRELAMRRRLPDAPLEQWLHLDESSRRAVLDIARALKLRTGQLLVALNLLDEISVREKTNIAALLSRPMFRRLLDGAGSAPERAHTFLNELRASRFPRLHETTQRLKSAIAAMRLPREIRILLPRELASDELTIQLAVAGREELERLLDVLMQKRGDLARILSILGGGDEV